MTSTPPLVILLIDDNPFFARHIQGMCAPLLSGGGDGWGWAGTAAEGLAQIERLRPTLVLLDPAMHADEPRLEDYCREVAAASAPEVPDLLFLTNPGHQLDGLIGRLTARGHPSVDSLNKPFTTHDLSGKVTASKPEVPAPELFPQPMPTPDTARFAWLATTPEVTGYAHLSAEGAVMEWMGEERHQGSHGALVYLQRLASLCGDDLGLGPAREVHAVGPEGCAFSLHLADGGALNILTSPRANLKTIAAQATEAAA